MVNDHLGRARRDGSGAHSFVFERQVLREHSERRTSLAECFLEARKSRADFGLRPVVSDAVTQAVFELQLEFATAFAILRVPVSGIVAHCA